MLFAKKNSDDERRPIVAITTGDPGGIGPEVVVKALRQKSVWRACRPVVVGRPAVILTHAAVLGLKLRLQTLDSIDDLSDPSPEKGIPFLGTCGLDETDQTRLGEACARGGLAAYESIKAAAQLCLEGKAAAMATAPINKKALAMAGINYPGHTEMLADMAGGVEVAMLMAGGGIRVALATIHVSLAEVPGLINREMLLRLFEMLSATFDRLGRKASRIGVCGLNPHAGDGGLFGREEIEHIAPAIALARLKGLDVSGPFAADSIFHRQLKGEFDLVVAMYHDQALIPVKTVAFDSAVNVTLGLPFPRASADHGTAYDIAGKNIAVEKSMVAAILAAAGLASDRMEF